MHQTRNYQRNYCRFGGKDGLPLFKITKEGGYGNFGYVFANGNYQLKIGTRKELEALFDDMEASSKRVDMEVSYAGPSRGYTSMRDFDVIKRYAKKALPIIFNPEGWIVTPDIGKGPDEQRYLEKRLEVLHDPLTEKCEDVLGDGMDQI